MKFTLLVIFVLASSQLFAQDRTGSCRIGYELIARSGSTLPHKGEYRDSFTFNHGLDFPTTELERCCENAQEAILQLGYDSKKTIALIELKYSNSSSMVVGAACND